jgi:hypothetical protein
MLGEPARCVPLRVSPMTRQILIVVGVAALCVAGFGLILGLVWLVSHLVLGVSPYILESRFQAMSGVLTVLCIVFAFVGASWMASALATKRKN